MNCVQAVDHPVDDRFTAGEFLAEPPGHGLIVEERWRTRVDGDRLLGVTIRQLGSGPCSL